nr:MAG TPA: hypothetical protein [Caudoviricetes sp.]
MAGAWPLPGGARTPIAASADFPPPHDPRAG